MPKYDKKDFIETPSGNKVSKRSLLAGIKHIKVSGKSIIMSGAVIRGDLAVVSIGRYTIIQQNAVIRPPYKRFKQLAFFTNFKIYLKKHLLKIFDHFKRFGILSTGNWRSRHD